LAKPSQTTITAIPDRGAEAGNVTGHMSFQLLTKTACAGIAQEEEKPQQRDWKTETFQNQLAEKKNPNGKKERFIMGEREKSWEKNRGRERMDCYVKREKGKPEDRAQQQRKREY